jgi:signal transduction histidine kinase
MNERMPTASRRWWFSKRVLPTPYVSTLLLMTATLLGAISVDYLALWPFIMTPLYAVPVLIAAYRLSPRAVGTTAALVTVVNLVSGLIQGTPLEIVLLYSSGLVMVAYLAVSLAWQRQRSSYYAAEAEQHAQAAEAAHQRLREFLSMITHDLRNPLTAILGYLQILHKRSAEITSEPQRRALSSIEAAAHEIDRLVNDLQDAGTIGAGHFSIQTARIDLLKVARRVINKHQAVTVSHQLTLDAPQQLEGEWDGERISQLLTNLISNAIKYSPRGGEVRVTVRKVAGEAVVSVSDQGIGLSREQIERLFQPFTRLYSGREIKGTGLGLYICKAIAEAHGGRIWVESKPGQGSTFSVALPWMTERSSPRSD